MKGKRKEKKSLREREQNLRRSEIERKKKSNLLKAAEEKVTSEF